MMQCKRSSSSAPSSAALIGGNHDLLIEFLLFLPAKALLRFQLVNKQWRSIISSPSFRHLHTLNHNRRRSKYNPSFLLRAITTTVSQFYIFQPSVNRLIPFRFKFPHITILQSCNGLLLLERRDFVFGQRYYYIFNPTTVQYRNLFLPKAFVGLCLVFDPYKSPYYRVICFMSYKNSNGFIVYDSKTHAWNDEVEFFPCRKNFCNAIYWNDGLFFIRFGCEKNNFYLKNEKIYNIDTPPRMHCVGPPRKYHAIESNGHLHSVLLSLKPNKKCLYVLEMYDVDYSWSIKYYVDFNPIAATFVGNEGKDISLIGMIRGEREEDSMLLFHVPGKIMSYGFVTKICEVLVDFRGESYFEEGRLQFEFKGAHQFVESLVAV